MQALGAARLIGGQRQNQARRGGRSAGAGAAGLVGAGKPAEGFQVVEARGDVTPGLDPANDVRQDNQGVHEVRRGQRQHAFAQRVQGRGNRNGGLQSGVLVFGADGLQPEIRLRIVVEEAGEFGEGKPVGRIGDPAEGRHHQLDMRGA